MRPVFLRNGKFVYPWISHKGLWRRDVSTSNGVNGRVEYGEGASVARTVPGTVPAARKPRLGVRGGGHCPGKRY